MRVTFERRLKEATQDSWDRLYKMLTDMSKKLTEDETAHKRYHDALLDNPRELCDLLKHLNVTNDPNLERARAKLEDALIGVDIEDVKDSAEQRADIKARVDGILKDFW
jgi:adenylate cyclase